MTSKFKIVAVSNFNFSVSFNPKIKAYKWKVMLWNFYFKHHRKSHILGFELCENQLEFLKFSPTSKDIKFAKSGCSFLQKLNFYIIVMLLPCQPPPTNIFEHSWHPLVNYQYTRIHPWGSEISEYKMLYNCGWCFIGIWRLQLDCRPITWTS